MSVAGKGKKAAKCLIKGGNNIREMVSPGVRALEMERRNMVKSEKRGGVFTGKKNPTNISSHGEKRQAGSISRRTKP